MPKLLIVSIAFPSVVLLSSLPLSAQVSPSASGGSSSEDEGAMYTPAPVSGMPYGSGESGSSFFEAALGVSGAYTDNLLPSATAHPITDASITIYPSIALDRSTSRVSERISYSPGFTFYTPTNEGDAIGHSASAGLGFHLTPHISLDVNETFLRTSNVLNQSYPFSNPVNGSTQASPTGLIVPYVGQMVDTTTGTLSYQYARNSMVGGSGNFSSYTLLNQGNVTGVFNSMGEGGSVYFSRRLSRSQYIGVSDGYSRTVSTGTGLQYESEIDSLAPYYSYYFNPQFSVSVSAGFSYIFPSGSSSTPNSWQPSFSASTGWSGKRANIAGSFSRSVYAGGGLIGVYSGYSFSASASTRMGKNWSANVSASYSDIHNITAPSAGFSTLATGNFVAGQVVVGRTFREMINLSFGYQRLHEDYDIPVISADPDSDRVFATLTYQFRKPLGR
jgi:hypothetical protein